MPLIDYAWYIDYGDGGTTGYYVVPLWTPTTVKVVGDLVRQLSPSIGNERVFVCVVGGTTDTSEPIWVITRGGKVIDGSVIWQEATGIAGLNGDLAHTPDWSQVSGGEVIGQVVKSTDGTKLLICSSIYDVDSIAIFAAFTTPPTEIRKMLIDNCVKALKTAGVWPKLDALYLYAAADSQAALINLVNPGTYDGTLVNGPTFNTDLGFTGIDGAYIDTNFNISSAPGAKYLQDSASVFGWGNTLGPLTGAIVGNTDGASNFIILIPHDGDGAYHSGLNGSLSSFAPAVVTGLHVVSRTAANLTTTYVNGASIGTDPIESYPLADLNVAFFQRYGTYWLGQICGGGFGAGLTVADNTALYNALRAYMTGVGIPDYADESIYIFRRFGEVSGPPTADRADLIDRTVKALKAFGVWAKLDALYVFAAADKYAGLVNWINPGTYDCIDTNAADFVGDRGLWGGPSIYMDTQFNPAIAPSPKLTQNSASLFAYSLSCEPLGGAIIHQGLSFLYPTGDGLFYGRVNNSYDEDYTAPLPTGSIGLWVGSRSGVNATEYWNNGVSFLTGGVTSITPSDGTFIIGNYWNGMYAVAGFGSALTATDNTNLYNTLKTYLDALGALQYDPNSEAIFYWFYYGATPERKALIDQTVRALKLAGIWVKLDGLYVFAAADQQAALVNWKNPGMWGTAINSPTFTADRGFYCDDWTRSIDTGFNPATAWGPNYVQDSATLFARVNNNVATDGAVISHDGIGAIQPRRTDDNAYARVNNSSVDLTVPNTDSIGLWSASRTAPDLTTLYKNGVNIGTSSGASEAVSDASIMVLTMEWGPWTGGKTSYVGFGGGLTDTENADLNRIMQDYLIGVGAFYQAESTAIFNAFTTPPTSARKTLIDNCVVALKSAGVWAKLDGLYLMAAADSQAAVVNWIDPAAGATIVNTLPFTVDSGFTGEYPGYIDTGFNPNVDPMKYTLNNASAFGWSLTSGSTTGAGILGAIAPGPPTMRIIPNQSSLFFTRMNSYTDIYSSSSSGLGLFCMSRASAAGYVNYKDGVQSAAPSNPSTAMTNGNILFICENTWMGLCAGGGFGASLTAADNTALYNALRAYLTGVGVP